MENTYKEIFGLDFQSEEIKPKGLPVYMTAGRSFFMMSREDVMFLLVRPSEDERFGIIALEKQMAQLSEKYDMPVAFGFSTLTKLQRAKLLERNIPFITDNGQLFLPFLGMMLNNSLKKERQPKREKMMPITQALFLFMLYKSNGQPVMKKDAAESLGVTRTSITRASEQLSSMGLISQEMRGKEYYMQVEGNGLDLYRKARPYLITPVQQILTVESDDRYQDYLVSGESALARTTMLNEPKIPVYAVYKADIDVSAVSQIDPKWLPDSKPVCIELWKYDPVMFAVDGVVDPISLSLCFEDNADERIEGATLEYLEGYAW